VHRGPGDNCADQDAFERKILAIRKQTQNPLKALAEKHGCRASELYMPSFSTRTIVYKGLLLATQVGGSMTICATRCAFRRWAWCTSAFPPTPSRAGSWRIPSASSRIR
jgi:glutamate synthase (NADPH/NADH) large chain